MSTTYFSTDMQRLKAIRESNLPEYVWTKIIKDFNMPVNFITHPYMCAILKRAVRCDLSQGTDLVYKWAFKMSQLQADQQNLFMVLVRKVTDLLIESTLNRRAYQIFNITDLNSKFPLKQVNIPSGDIYNRQNIHNNFLSIDISSAAFQAFKYWDINMKQFCDDTIIPDGVDDYRSWVKYIVDNELTKEAFNTGFEYDELVNYICDSKQIRQVIFGKTNPKRIQHIEKYMVQQLMYEIESETGILPTRLNNDELIYDEKDFGEHYVKTMNSILSIVNKRRLTIQLHVNEFELNAYKMKQIVSHEYLGQSAIFDGPTVYVKDGAEYKPYKWIVSRPSFKCLPSNLALAFEQMYKVNRGINEPASGDDDIDFFLNIPSISDKYLKWNSYNCTWGLVKLTSENPDSEWKDEQLSKLHGQIFYKDFPFVGEGKINK